MLRIRLNILKLRANALDSLLKNYDMYETMLQQYEDGTGSMAREAEKTANSWAGSINRLSNSWTDFINNFVETDGVKGVVNFLNNIVILLDKITGYFGSGSLIVGGLGTIFTNKLGLD